MSAWYRKYVRKLTNYTICLLEVKVNSSHYIYFLRYIIINSKECKYLRMYKISWDFNVTYLCKDVCYSVFTTSCVAFSPRNVFDKFIKVISNFIHIMIVLWMELSHKNKLCWNASTFSETCHLVNTCEIIRTISPVLGEITFTRYCHFGTKKAPDGPLEVFFCTKMIFSLAKQNWSKFFSFWVDIRRPRGLIWSHFEWQDFVASKSDLGV